MDSWTDIICRGHSPAVMWRQAELQSCGSWLASTTNNTDPASGQQHHGRDCTVDVYFFNLRVLQLNDCSDCNLPSNFVNVEYDVISEVARIARMHLLCSTSADREGIEGVYYICLTC